MPPQYRNSLVRILVTAAGLGSLACARHPAPQPSPAASASVAGASPVIPAEPVARAAEAAVYALPLVIMDLTREQFFQAPSTAVATPNRFLHVPILANPTFRAVVRPNVDTLYSTAWLDVSAEPVILTVPPSHGRYYMVQCMDAWTNVFAAPGIRTLGDRGAKFAIVGPDWHGSLGPEITVLRSPTAMVWLLGRTYIQDANDLAAARAFQHQLDVRPASRAGSAAYDPVYPLPLPSSRRIMREVLQELSAQAFFERFAQLLVANRPAAADAPFVAQVLAPLGITPGVPLIWASLPAPTRSLLTRAYARVLEALGDRKRLTPPGGAPTGWTSMGAELSQGNYGVNYRVRAAIAMIGLGANLRVDAVYMNDSVDGNHQAFDGSRHYRLAFVPGKTPPNHAFWSVTLYDMQGYLIENPAGRYAVKSADALAHEPDGSIVIYLQPDDPGPEHRANWLPTPAHQPFELSLRAYWPGDELLDGRWIPPAVTAVD